MTVNDVLSTIPPHATLHNPQELRNDLRLKPRVLSPADGNAPLKKLIDTAGVHALHPNGDRWFTWREQMALQGLPNHHQLVGKTKKDFSTQIGNGVPVMLGKALFAKVVESLEESDRVIEAWDNEHFTID